ncbi:MAG: hypothetical protein QM756_08655 [Polyangiaceae bacterium]
MSLSPSVAHAGSADSAPAQALFDQAKSLMSEGRFAEACGKLEESQRLDPALGTLLNLADCNDKAGKLASAWSLFRDAEAQAKRDQQADAATVAHDRAVALAERVPRLVIEVTDSKLPGLKVRRNDTQVGSAQWGTELPLDPGSYQIVASADGYREWRTSVTLEEGAAPVKVSVPTLTRSADKGVDLVAEAPSSGSSVPVLSYVFGGVGLAATAGGVVLALSAKSQYNSADCPQNACRTDADYDKRSSAVTKANVATVLVGVGAASLVTGVAIWVFSPTKKSGAAQRSELRVGLGQVSLSGSF